MRPFTRAAFLSRILPAALLVSLLAVGLCLPAAARAFVPEEPEYVGGGYYYDDDFVPAATLNAPNDVAVAPDGTVFVADTGNRRVVVLDSEGDYVRQWDYQSVHANAGPLHLECTSGGDVVVVFDGTKDAGGNDLPDFAQRFRSDGTPVGNEMASAVYTTGLALDGTDSIYITSAVAEDGVGRFSPTGIPSEPLPTGVIRFGDPVVEPSGHLCLIAFGDGSNDHGYDHVGHYEIGPAGLQQSDTGQLPLRHVAGATQYSASMEFAAFGRLVVSVPIDDVLRQFKDLGSTNPVMTREESIGVLPSGELLLSSPRGISVDVNQAIYVADTGHDRIVRLRLREPGTTLFPYDDLIPAQGVGKSNALDVVFVSGIWSSYTPGIVEDNGFGMIFDYMDDSGRYDVVRVPASVEKPADPGAIWSNGPLSYNSRALANFLKRQPGLAGRKVLFVSHSMGGLISRAFVDDDQLVRSANVVPKAIVQIGTPNTGSEMVNHWNVDWRAEFGAFLASPAMRDLSPAGALEFNLANKNQTGVPIWGVAGDYFPDGANEHLAVHLYKGDDLTAHYALEKLYLKLNEAFGGLNDGWVSVASASGSSLTLGHRSLFDRVNSAKHTQDLTYPFDTFEDASYIKPMDFDEGPVAREAYDDLWEAVEGAVADPACYNLGGLGGSGGGFGGGSGAEEEPAKLFSRSSLAHNTPISSDSSVRTAVHVSGSTSVITARTDAGSVSLALRDQYGTAVPLEAASGSPGVYVAMALVPGTYELEAVLTGASSALLALDVVESEGPVLRYDVPAQVVAGSPALVTASVASSEATLTSWSGQVVTDDGTVPMNDAGVAGDATPGDGVFSALVTAGGSGRFREASVIASGTDSLGRSFQRVGVAVQSVGEPIASMAATGTLAPVYSGGYVSAMELALPVRGAVDASVGVRAELVDATGTVVAAGETESRVAADTTASITISFPAQLLHSGMSSSGQLRVSSVWLEQVLPDGSTTLIGHRTNVATSAVLSPSGLDVSYCSLRMDEGALAAEKGVRLTGRAVCATSRIATVQVSFDEGATWRGARPKDGSFDSFDEEYEVAFILPDGVWRARSRALGVNGQQITPSDGWGDLTVPVDLDAPTTTTNIDSAWHKSPFAVTLTASDRVTFAAATKWRIGGIEATYTGSFEVSGSGLVPVQYWSHDELGHEEDTKTATLKLDGSGPTVSSDATASYTRSAAFSLTAADSQSGFRSLSCQSDTGTVVTATTGTAQVSSAQLGAHHVDWTAEDMVGNVSTGTIVFQVEPAAVLRIAGCEAFGTDVALSQATYNTGTRSSVVLISRDSTADAMCAPGLAGAVNGPIFMTPASQLATGVLDEMLRVLNPAGVKKVYIIGNHAAVSSAVENALDAAGLDPDRLYGGTVYDTAVKVANKVKSIKGSGWAKTVFIVRHDNTAGGMAAAPYSYMRDYPLLFVTQNALPTTTSVALTEDLDVTYAYEMGSPTYISTTVHAAIDAKIQTAERINYTSRYDLARAMADKAISKGWATPSHTCVTTGDDYRTGIAGASAVGVRQGVLLQTSGSTVPPATSDFVADNKSGVYYLDVFGPEQEVPASVVSQLQGILGD